jgi:hypothetical protein
MHLLKKIPRRRFGQFGTAAQLTPEQQERLLQSVDADVEALLLDVDEVEGDVLLALRSIDSGSDADAATLASLEQSLDRAEELKQWCRAMRSEAAAMLSQAR